MTEKTKKNSSFLWIMLILILGGASFIALKHPYLWQNLQKNFAQQPTTPPPAPENIIADRMEKLERRIADIYLLLPDETIVTRQQKMMEHLETLNTKLNDLEQTIAELKISDPVPAPMVQAQEPTPTPAPAVENTAWQTSLFLNFKNAVESGHAFDQELNLLRQKMTDETTQKILTQFDAVATTGMPGMLSLRTDLEKLRTMDHAPQPISTRDQIKKSLAGLITIRPAEQHKQNTHIEMALEAMNENNIEVAIQMLKNQQGTEIQNWITRAQTRVTTLAALRQLQNEILANNS